jgi:hypothetical protein
VPTRIFDRTGCLSTELLAGTGRSGVFGLYDEGQMLVYVGVASDCCAAAVACLVRRPSIVAYYAGEYVGSRIGAQTGTALEEIRARWIADWANRSGGLTVSGCDGGVQQGLWENAIDVRGSGVTLTADEQDAISDADAKELPKVLKLVVKRVQEDIEATLRKRGLTDYVFKFATKPKSAGRIELEPTEKNRADGTSITGSKDKVTTSVFGDD